MNSPLLLEQRTEAWRMARAGKVTASCIADVLAKVKGREATTRANYRAQIIAEVLTGTPADNPFVSRPMQWGIDTEPFARAAYELKYEVMIDTVGFVLHPTIESFGASPDGMIGKGLVQFKCPHTATHIEYLLKGDVPAEYQHQMLAEMACTNAAWCDFVSFDPRLPSELQLFVRRFPRDQTRIAEIELEVTKFLAEVKDMLVRLSCLGDMEPLLRKSVEIAKLKHGPQPIVAILDQGREDYA
jgi:putative phage-type endonuclease